MTTHNANNVRIKHKYFAYLKETQRHSEQTIDPFAKALARFEVYTKHKDFKAFHFEQAINFKRHLAEQKGQQSGKKLSKATLHSTLTALKKFFQWLSRESGYKTRVRHNDADYFNLSGKDTRIGSNGGRLWYRSSTSSIRCQPPQTLSAGTARSSPSRC
jgi:site-specific recombinase XerC